MSSGVRTGGGLGSWMNGGSEREGDQQRAEQLSDRGMEEWGGDRRRHVRRGQAVEMGLDGVREYNRTHTREQLGRWQLRLV